MPSEMTVAWGFSLKNIDLFIYLGYAGFSLLCLLSAVMENRGYSPVAVYALLIAVSSVVA